MNVLHGNLKPVEAPCFGYLNFCAKLLSQIFEHDAVTCCEEGKDVFDEMLFFFIEFLPILEILVEVDLIGSPKRCQMFFVHFEDGMVLYGK